MEKVSHLPLARLWGLNHKLKPFCAWHGLMLWTHDLACLFSHTTPCVTLTVLPVGRTLPEAQSVKSLSGVQLFATAWTAACQASLSITNSQSFLKLRSIESVMPSDHLIRHSVNEAQWWLTQVPRPLWAPPPLNTSACTLSWSLDPQPSGHPQGPLQVPL